MKNFSKILFCLMLILVIAAPLIAQERDPLSDSESDQLRETAQEPLKRLKLFIKFASERLDTIQAIQNDQDANGRGQRVHDAIANFGSIIDELDDNIDDYVDKQDDIRKGLNAVITAEEGFQKRLEAIHALATKPDRASEYQQYNFTLEDATDAVNMSLEDAKKTLAQQTGAQEKKK